MESVIEYPYPSAAKNFDFRQTLNIRESGTSDKAQTVENYILNESTQRKWHQVLDLKTGTWTQSHYVSDILIWQDSWDMSKTLYNPYKFHPTNTLLAAQPATDSTAHLESNSSSSWTMSAVLVASAIFGASIYTCTQLQKRKVDEAADDYRRPLLM